MMEDLNDYSADEIKNQAAPANTNHTVQPAIDYPRVRVVLLVLLGFCAMFSLLGAVLYQLVAVIVGWDNALLSSGISADSSVSERNQMRLLLGLNHLCMFMLSGGITVWIFYRRYVVNRYSENAPAEWLNWRDYLGVNRLPSLRLLVRSLAVMAVSAPLVLYSYEVNKMLPLPEVFHSMEANTNEAIKGLLVMNSPFELIANLVIIALLPSLGEELIFRGIVQQQIMRRVTQPLMAILASAAIFSFIHFQFEGFLPRLILGFVLGWLYWRTGNFWIPVAAHFFNNGMQVVMQYLYGQKMSDINMENDIQVPWFSAVVSVVLLGVLAKYIQADERI